MDRKHSRFMRFATFVTFFFPLFFTACSDKLVPPETGDPDTKAATFSGTIINETGKPLPEDAAIIVVWSVSSGSPDYGYVYGRGEIDRANNTFTIDLDELPEQGRNSFYPEVSFGVGYVFVLPDSMTQTYLTQGSIHTDDIEGDFYGAINYANLIYLDDDPDSLEADGNCRRTWLKTFSKGYGFGKGKANELFPSPCIFDGFVPAPKDSIEIIISNDPQRFTGVNWT